MTMMSRRRRLDLIPPLDMRDEFRLFYEAHAGGRHRVRVSRSLPGGELEGDLEELLTQLRPWRRRMADGGIMAVVFWIDEAAAMYDALIGDDHGA